LQRLLFLIISAFTSARQPKGMFAGYGPWAEALDSLILFPVVAAAVLVATLDLLRLLRLPPVLQVSLAALASCAINGILWWPLAIVVAPLFLLSAYAYSRWYAESLWVALAYTILIMVVSGLPAGISAFQHATRSA
jgi:hypothetical protein